MLVDVHANSSLAPEVLDGGNGSFAVAKNQKYLPTKEVWVVTARYLTEQDRKHWPEANYAITIGEGELLVKGPELFSSNPIRFHQVEAPSISRLYSKLNMICVAMSLNLLDPHNRDDPEWSHLIYAD